MDSTDRDVESLKSSDEEEYKGDDVDGMNDVDGIDDVGDMNVLGDL